MSPTLIGFLRMEKVMAYSLFLSFNLELLWTKSFVEVMSFICLVSVRYVA